MPLFSASLLRVYDIISMAIIDLIFSALSIPRGLSHLLA